MLSAKAVAMLVFATLAVLGCGDRGEQRPLASQVAAKVNSGEISVHQINYVLQRAPGPIKPELAEEAKKQALESLIDQELAVQQAMEAKLERNPEVLEGLEAARREVLARAYLEKQLGGVGKPTVDEVRRYFSDHPELFSSRKIYRLEEVVFKAHPENVATVKEMLATSKSTAEIATALKAKGIEAAAGVTVKPAEQIVLDLLPELARQKEGLPQLYVSGDQAAVITVIAAKAEPIAESQATPVIEQFLVNRQRGEQARELVRQLRAAAKIEYRGEFVAHGSTSQPSLQVAKSAAREENAAAADRQPNPSAISKGIAGLK